jgi:type IV secretory pathway TraG/TraD family ATPase VirD4
MKGWVGVFTSVALFAASIAWGLRQGRAPVDAYFKIPLRVLVMFVITAILQEFAKTQLHLSRDSIALYLVSTLCIALVCALGYLHGRGIASKSITDGHRRGTLLLAGAPGHHPNQKESLALGPITLPPADETKHIKLLGTTGTGKSSAIRSLLHAALSRGDRALIADPDGGYLERFYDEGRGDLILNPFDARSRRWDLYAELRESYDIEQLARSMIPDGDSPAGAEWRGYARTFFAAVLKQTRQIGLTSIAELNRLLTAAPEEELRELLASTPAQPFLADGNSRMFSSIRSVTASALAAFPYIDEQTSAPMSVREWVKTGRGTLFIPYRADHIAPLRDLIAAWVRLAVFEALSASEGDQRLWFIVDELDALGKIDGLKDALARLRKFGGRCVLGFQSIGQVAALYGHGDAQTIIENCGNTVVFRCSASEDGGTSRFASRLIGEREIVRRALSRGTTTPNLFSRGGISTNTTESQQFATESAVLPSEIEQLSDGVGIVKIASQPEWRIVDFPYNDQPRIAPAFIPSV